jgi:hypothetical protein
MARSSWSLKWRCTGPQAPAEDRLERYALRRATRNGSTEQLVVQMSELLAELADSIARSLHDRDPS